MLIFEHTVTLLPYSALSTCCACGHTTIQEWVNFLKTTKLHRPVGHVQFVVFEKLTSAHHTKLQEKSWYYLLKICMERHHRKARQMKFWKQVCAICNLHLWYNFAFVLHENVLILSQSEASNFLMYIIESKLAHSQNSSISESRVTVSNY